MSEIDLRKLPLSRKEEAFDKIKIVRLQKYFDEEVLIDDELIKMVNKNIRKDMKEYETQKGTVECWMDFGEDFLSEGKLEMEEVLNSFINFVRDKDWGEASECLVKYIKDNYHIYTTRDDKTSEMWIYKRGIYIPEGRSSVKEILRTILAKWHSSYICNLVMNKLEADTYIDTDEFFNQNNIEEVPVMNGILNITSRTLEDFSPERIFFNKLNVYYNKESSCPQIKKFLKGVLACEDDIDVFFELGGFCLLKEYRFEKAFMLVGDGRNGKDKSLELLKRTFGLENCCSVPLSSIKLDSFIISEFFGKMVNIAGEINNQDLKDTSSFKALTGRSIVSAPRKFLKPITFENYAKFIFACNELPMVYDNSKGFWDRWVLLEFPYTFVTKEEIESNPDDKLLKLRDENIIDKITTSDELSGLLNLFLDGLERLKESKSFSSTKGSKEIKDIWIRKSNSFFSFILDKIEEDYDKFITKKELRQKYIKYCKNHKVNPKSDYVIKRSLQETFGASEDRKESGSNNWEWVWVGVKWK